MKYIVAVCSFLFSWFGVVLIVGIVVGFVFPPIEGKGIVLARIFSDWRNLPGNILGIGAGVHSARVSLRGAERKRKRKAEEELLRNSG